MRFEQVIEEFKAKYPRKELMEISLEHGYGRFNLYMRLWRMGLHGGTTVQKFHETAEMLGYKVMYTIDNGPMMTREEAVDRLQDMYRECEYGRHGAVCLENGYCANYIYEALRKTRRRAGSLTHVPENIADMLGHELGYELVPLKEGAENEQRKAELLG